MFLSQICLHTHLFLPLHFSYPSLNLCLITEFLIPLSLCLFLTHFLTYYFNPSLLTYLFCVRALKTRSNTPKYGLLFHSTFIGRAGIKNKGRISRYLANKCSIASRIDCFSGECHFTAVIACIAERM